MRISFHASVFTPAASFEQTIEAAAQAGASGVEIPIGQDSPLTFETPQATCTDWSQLARTRGVSISSLTIDDPKCTDFGVADDALRQAAMERVIASLDRAKWLEAGTLVLAPGIVSLGRPATASARYEDVHTRSLEALLALRFEAELRGVRVACRCGENGFLISPIEMRSFLDRINSPWVFASLNLNAIQRVGAPQDWLVTLARRLGHVCMVLPGDSCRRPERASGHEIADPLPLGEDAWPVIGRAIRETRYPGPLTWLGHGEASELTTRIGELLQSSAEDAECD